MLIYCHPTVSKAFWKSKKRAIPGILVSSEYDIMSENLRPFSPMYWCFSYPVWYGLIFQKNSGFDEHSIATINKRGVLCKVK